MSESKQQQTWNSMKTSKELINRLNESDSLEYIDKENIFSCTIYKENWDEKEREPNGIKGNIKTIFTDEERSDITGTKPSNDCNINFVFIGISFFGDIIEVGKSSLEGDWAYKIYFEKGVSSEYLEYIIAKTLESSQKIEAKELLNKITLNLNKFYERMIILPIVSVHNTDDDIAKQMERVVGEDVVIPFTGDNKNIKFVRPNSHKRTKNNLI